MRKIVIVMPYYNRGWQLIQTLDSINKSKHVNFEVIIVDDGSRDLGVIDISEYKFKIHTITITKAEKKEKGWIMPLASMNMGMKKALDLGAEIIILQNCEARHLGEVLLAANQDITEENYISYGCFSLSRESTYDPNLEQNIYDIIKVHNVCAVDGEHDSWYNHPLLRGTGYDFCAAITRENLIKLNGYDERYATGFCYGDDDFVMRVKRLGLKIEITTEPIVLHQWHGDSMGIRDDSLVIKNANLYHQIANSETGFKAKHIYTEDFA